MPVIPSGYSVRRAGVAQLVERRLPKPKVTSSSLVARFTESPGNGAFLLPGSA